MDERHRQPHSLPLPHREPVGPPVGEAFQAKDVERLVDRGGSLARRDESESRAEIEMPAGAESRVEGAIAGRKEAEPGEVRTAIVFGVQPVDRDGTRLGMNQPGRDPQQRRLTGSVGATDRDERTSPSGRSRPSRIGWLPQPCARRGGRAVRRRRGCRCRRHVRLGWSVDLNHRRLSSISHA